MVEIIRQLSEEMAELKKQKGVDAKKGERGSKGEMSSTKAKDQSSNPPPLSR